MQRVLEPEVMDTLPEASEYDAMDFLEVNAAFAQRAIQLGPSAGLVLDAGTGTARIPILICQQRPQWRIVGIDLAQHMLRLGEKNIEQAGLQTQITLELVDSKRLPYQEELFDMVISNSLVHHLPEPLPFFQQIKRVLKPKGAILLRDLLRPANEVKVNQIVDGIGSDYSAYQKQLFRDSLCAAFTLDEVEAVVQQSGLGDVQLYQSSDLHWTLERLYA